ACEAVRTAPGVAGPAAAPRQVGDVAASDAGGRQRWASLAADLVTAIRASATPQRQDRLFPGDIDQFRVAAGGLGIAYGAAGVLYTLDEVAGTCLTDKWQRMGHGLFDGLSGFGLALLDLAESAAEPAFGDAGLKAAE